MTILRSGFGDAGGYEIEKSLRSKGASLNRISRQFTVAPTDPKKGTLSLWFKRSKLGAVQYLLGATNAEFIEFQASDKLRISNISGSPYWITTRVFRDPSAWMNLTIAWDSTQAIASNRGRVWVNGAEITAWDSKPDITQNSEFYGWAKNLGGIPSTLFGSAYFDQNFDGYGAEVYWVDGQFLTPDNFGEFNSNGVWVPKKYTGTYGNNGFYLDFKDGTSLTTLGHDKSGNNNHWTLNGYSLTAGATYDWMDDTPTNNFAVLNPLNKSAAVVSLEANLRAYFGSTGSWQSIMANVPIPTSGVWCWEIQSDGLIGTGTNFFSGISTADFLTAGNYPGGTANSWSIYIGSGNKYTNGVATAYGPALSTSDVLGHVFDADAGTLTLYKNGVSMGVAFTGLTASMYFAAVGTIGAGCRANFGQRPAGCRANFGQRPLAYTYGTAKALCTKNLPSVSITNPASHFDIDVYTGTGAAQTRTGILFQPDMLWGKSRSSAYFHNITDTVRGLTKYLYSNLTSVEGTYTDKITGVATNGFSLGADTSTQGSVNVSGSTQVMWLWKAGGAPVANNVGTIPSQVSVNQQAGFSIVSYTGTGGNATVGHGLGVAPKMVIVKRRNSTSDWPVWHQNVAAGGSDRVLFLNTTDAQTASGSNFNSSSPTSSVINVGTNPATNAGSGTHVAYCFAEVQGYSKIDTYIGNASADGPFVYCGFKPKYVLIKSSTVATSWYEFDSKRNINESKMALFPDTAAAESNNVYGIDMLSNGFKVRAPTGYGINNASATYVYIAFAENPFGGSNVAPATAR